MLTKRHDHALHELIDSEHLHVSAEVTLSLRIRYGPANARKPVAEHPRHACGATVPQALEWFDA